MNIKKYSYYVGPTLTSGIKYQFNIGYYEEPITCFFLDDTLHVFTSELVPSANNKKLDICVLDGYTMSSFLDDRFSYLDKQIVYKNNLTNASYGNKIEMNLISTFTTYLYFKKVEKTKEQLREEKINEITDEN